jgi:amino acid adenylation domain-containing protein
MNKKIDCLTQYLGVVQPQPIQSQSRKRIDEPGDTWTQHQRDILIYQLFEAQAERRADAIAVSDDDGQISYGELNHSANMLANYLRSIGVGLETAVGIGFERSIDMVIAMLAVLKAGGVYVPLDLKYPRERLKYIIEDSQIDRLLTRKGLVENIPAGHVDLVCIDSQWEAISRMSRSNLNHCAIGGNLAYMIYTSGSTGTPKGIEITHEGLLNLVHWHNRAYGVAPGDRATQLASVGFDASVWELWPYLASGATVLIVSDQMRLSSEALRDWLVSEAVTFCFLPTPLAEIMLQLEWPGNCPLKTMLTGGDKLRYYPPTSLDFEFVNHYGPTEFTVVATCSLIRPNEDATSPPPIGSPISNTQTHVLGPDLDPMTDGEPGELHLAGESLARGYHNRPDLTSERFIPNLFTDKPGSRLYRTGDLVRRSKDGDLCFLGRIDNQVKIRGYRIEPAEIEFALLQHEKITEAAVIAQEDMKGEKHLIGYIVADGENPPDSSELKSYLLGLLPDHMVPSGFVKLERIPLTANGKLDLQALPAPSSVAAAASHSSSLSLLSPCAQIIASAWSELLGVPVFSADDDFFLLGGHSLLATRCVSRLRKLLKIELSLRELFEHSSLGAFSSIVERALSGTAQVDLGQIQPADRSQDLELSFAQQRLWFLQQLDPDNAAYNVPIAVRIQGKLDVFRLEQAINLVITRQEGLRATFIENGGIPVQIIKAAQWQKLGVISLERIEEAERRTIADDLMKQEACVRFDLEQGPLCRATLVRLSDEEHILLLNLHHIVTDGWSMGVMFEQVGRYYEQAATGEPIQEQELELQYADYAQWQREWLEQQQCEQQLSYWMDHLQSAPPLLELPTDRPRPPVQSFRGSKFFFAISDEIRNKLIAESRRHAVTPYMLLLAAFQTLLYRYSHKEDFVVGTEIANRNRTEVEEVIGFFANTLALRAQVDGNMSFRELLERVRDVTVRSYAHQDMPFEKLVEVLKPERQASFNPLFQVMFVFQNTPRTTFAIEGLNLTTTDVDSGTSKFDMTLVIADTQDGLEGLWEYSTDLFDRTTMQRMTSHFTALLKSVLENPNKSLGSHPLLSPAEVHQAVIKWNPPETYYANDKCIHDLFTEQALRTPDAIAVTQGSEQISYARLNTRANQLAHYLRSIGVSAESLVGLCLDRSIQMIVGMLGILKAGGAYVPLDPGYPRERLDYMIRHARIDVLVTQSHLADKVPGPFAHVACLDTDWQMVDTESEQEPESNVVPANLAYVIFTSGSTGKPKGVMIAHSGLCNLSMAQLTSFGQQPENRCLQFASVSFDASIFEIVMAFCAGATLYVASGEQLQPGPPIKRFLSDHGITTVTLPPSVLTTIEESNLPTLNTIIVAGEACQSELAGKWAPSRRFFNAYGPTETTVWATLWEQRNYEGKPPIGKAIQNTQAYLLDQGLNVVPIGVSGELHVGGIGIARGYLGLPELTAERFIPDLFGKPGGRLYKTGDLARYFPDGNIEFINRLDNQVKTRGFRIELGEIEATINAFPGVTTSIALLVGKGSGASTLAALVVQDDEGLSLDALKDHLSGHLPDYMIPSSIILLDELPLTPNKKIDKDALVAMAQMRQERKVYVEPKTEMENVIAAVWQQVLQIDRVGVFDNFFDLGGHSLLIAQVHNRLQEILQRDLSLLTVFKYPSIESLARYLTDEPIDGSPIGDLKARANKQKAVISRRAQRPRRSLQP